MMTRRLTKTASVLTLTVAIASLLGLLLTVTTRRVRAANTITVTSTSDHVSGSLRAAIAAAQDGDTIVFNLPSYPATITITDTALFIDKPLTINGPGADKLTINSSLPPSELPFTSAIFVTQADTVTLTDLTLSNGSIAGLPFCITNLGTLQLDRCKIKNCQSTLPEGSPLRYAIISTGRVTGGSPATLTCNDCTISDNQCGGILGDNLSLTNCTVSNNMGTGAIMFDLGIASLNNCTFSDNAGGGFSGRGSADHCTFSHNQGVGVKLDITVLNGAPVFASVDHCIISDNAGSGINGDFITVKNSRITGNGGAGISMSPSFFFGIIDIDKCSILNNGSPSAEGGGIRLFGAIQATINNSTISGNQAASGGGIFYAGSLLPIALENLVAGLTINNSTISGNSAAELGGGIFSTGDTTLRNCTITGNTATQNYGGVWGVFILPFSLADTIVAGNIAGGVPNDLASPTPIVAPQHNLIGDAATSGGITNGVDGNIVGVNGAGTRDIHTILNTTLANNGGPTLTHTLVPGSPALDAGDNAFVSHYDPATDQRGRARLVDGNDDNLATIDIGAVEMNVAPMIAAHDFSIAKSSQLTDVPIATISDAVDVTGTLDFKVNGAASATLFGVRISNLHVTLNGTITAVVTADCSASHVGFTLSVTNSENQTATAQLIVMVTASEPPSFASCADITKGTDPNKCSAVITYTPMITDDCSTATVTCEPPSGSVFQKGSTSVTCTATDADSNTSQCSFTVTVKDTQAPTVSCPANITQAADAQCSAVVNYTASATDNCDGALTPTCTPPSGSRFQSGTTSVTCTAKDAANNQGENSFSITVNDTSAPTINCANVTAQSANTDGNCAATVPNVTALVRAQTSDNCTARADLVITQSPAANSTVSGAGSHPITVTVKDAANNSQTCTVGFTLNDTTPPVINCPANLTKSTDPNQCAAVVSFAPTASDNCSGASAPTCAPPSGTVFPKGTTSVTCTVKDAANNQSLPCSFTVTVNDTQPPAITPPASISVPATARLCSAVVTYNAPVVSDNCPGVGAPTCTPPSGTSFPKGTTVVNCSVRDAANNQGGAAFTITVVDTQPPTIACPPNVVAATVNAGDVSVAVSYETPSTIDNCGSVSVVCNPPSGAQFARGTTTVTCTATDASNNQTNCSFTVRVFNYVIVDDTNGKIVRFDSATGDYDFFDCRKNKSLSGRGTVTVIACKTSLTDSRPDRNVAATANPCTKVGGATVIYQGVTHTLNDASLSNNIASCP